MVRHRRKIFPRGISENIKITEKAMKMGVSKKRRPNGNQVSPCAPGKSRHGGSRAGAGRKPGSNKRSSAVEPRADALTKVVAGSQLPHYEEQNGPDDPMPHPTEIARETCGTLNALRAHLAAVVHDLRLVREIADAETAGDDNPARARLVEKVLSLPGLIKAANDLTSAIARLADIGPGKKATAMDLAKSADSGLFATPAAPKRTLQ
jgi:hypothetical protein